MNRFELALLADLSAFSGELLERGLGTAGRLSAMPGGSRSTSILLRAADRLANLLPSLIADCEAEELATRPITVETPVPVRAELSRSPAAYELVGDRLLPKRWLRTVPARTTMLEPLQWVVYIAGKLADELRLAGSRYETWIADARASRRGTSVYAALDEQALNQIHTRIKSAERTVSAVVAHIHRLAGRRIRPAARIPPATPRTPSWRRLMREVLPLVDPSVSLALLLRALLSEPVEAADLPFLYQRWCGVKIVETMRRLGWKTRRDPVGPLFLGGLIVFECGGYTIDLWVEPRIGRDEPHPCGLVCRRAQDATPDFVFTVACGEEHDAFCIDATLSTEENTLEEKTKYLALLRHASPSVVAGVAVRRPPRRAWAMAPLKDDRCRLGDSEQPGTTGVVPMHPVEFRPEPLAAWLGDLMRYAAAGRPTARAAG
ncbi:MAG: hypothetical protein D6815_09685 [Candidatus Dadabacteria bacterium]|nr:MAG: hypothetical protein D6815_09685 [Candidatus Dadabacteria bacterium]